MIAPLLEDSMRNILLSLVCIVCLSCCASVSKSLSDVRSANEATGTAISEAQNQAVNVITEADEIAKLVSWTGDEALIDVAFKHAASTKSLKRAVDDIKVKHDAAVAALAVSDDKVNALEQHDTEMTKKARNTFWKLFTAYAIASLKLGKKLLM